MTLNQIIKEAENLFDEMKKDFLAVQQGEWWATDEDYIKSFLTEQIKLAYEAGQNEGFDRASKIALDAITYKPSSSRTSQEDRNIYK